MLQEGSLGDLAPQQSEVLPVLIQKADQMNRLVEQMLEASRLEEGRLELSIEPADLRELVRAAIDEVRPLADEAHPFNLAVPGDEVTVAVDRQRVTSIVTNLLSNAIKYSPRGGEVSCAIARDGQALVSVSDRGVGIAPEDMNSLFTRFGRVQTPETRNVPGTGLGLYLSRELARLHGGELTVSSKPGQGSTFTLRLPLAQS
jgi:signal transduction histidine kinase